MEIVLTLFVVMGLLGALDNYWHHEVTERLPSKPSARVELTLHAGREALYAFLFIALAWWTWHGAWAWLIVAVLLTEVAITIADFLEEDRTRVLPPFERALHTVMALIYGCLLAILIPVLWDWSGDATAVTSADNGWFAPILTLYGIGVGAWAIRNALAVHALGAARTTVYPVPTAESPRTVLVIGGTGFIGRALVPTLVARGDRVIIQSRDIRKVQTVFGEHVEAITSLDEIPRNTTVEAVIGLAGAPVIGMPWTKTRRRQLTESRAETWRSVETWLETRDARPDVMIAASAVGYYGGDTEGPLSETAGPGSDFVASVGRAVEAGLARVDAPETRTCVFRIGLVLDKDGGVLPALALPMRLGLGAILGSGRQPMPWIAREDVVRLMIMALDNPRYAGPINAVAPDPPSHMRFMIDLRDALRRPLWFCVPGAPIRLLLGEMSDLLLKGQRAVPTKALELGFAFAHPDLPRYLAARLGKRDRRSGLSLPGKRAEQ